MKSCKSIITVLLSLLVLLACSKENEIYNVVLDDIDSRGSYSFGRLLGKDTLDNGIVVSGGYFAKGVYDNNSMESPWYAIDEMNVILQDYQKQYYQADIKGEAGKEYTSFRDIKALKKPTDLQDKFSYVWGFANSPKMYTGSIGVNLDAFIFGYLSTLYGKESLFTDEELEENLALWQSSVEERYNESLSRVAEENLRLANEFLESNKSKGGIIVFESGLQLEKLVKVNDGAYPLSGDSVVVDYKLSLIDGTVADQGSDAVFSTDSLIPGFVEAVKNMKVGERVLAYIPPALGYGEADLGAIKPNSLLIFDITLKGIE